MITDKLNKLPPCLCRVIARDLTSKCTALTTAQISKVSGLSIQKINHISEQDSWLGITIGDAEAFLKGCGITSDNFRRHVAYVNRTVGSRKPFHHIDKGGVSPKVLRKIAMVLNPDSKPAVTE